MSAPVDVKTDGDAFANLECGAVLVELAKDGDSPSCPNSWTWHLWIDGNHIDATCEEASLAQSVRDVTEAIETAIGDLAGMRDYLVAYGAFGKEPE